VDHKFRTSWRSYLFQSLCTVLAMLVVLLAFDLRQAIVITSLGATVFVVFMMPSSIPAQPRRVIGGHLVGLVSGSLLGLIPHDSAAGGILVAALAVGLAAFLMVVLNAEHPPAAGTALTVVVEGPSTDLVVGVLGSVVVLAIAHHFLKRRLKDLV